MIGIGRIGRLGMLNREHTLLAKFKNMKAHLKFDVSLDWLMQFDFNKLKILNKMICTRDRVKKYFNVDKYTLS